mmetsp:Transcript_10053/g.31559  ORF Transcript_10053/g.31559 Transcript_10053/m.31559 type:complete len:352 (+) Transcript_10053:786-1841(+)
MPGGGRDLLQQLDEVSEALRQQEVRLVYADVLDVRELDVVLPVEFQEAVGRGHEEVHNLRDLAPLLDPGAAAAVDKTHAKPGLVADELEDAAGLHRELPCRADHQADGRGGPEGCAVVHATLPRDHPDLLHERQHVGQGLPGAGLCRDDEVLARQLLRDGRDLHRRWRDEVRRARVLARIATEGRCSATDDLCLEAELRKGLEGWEGEVVRGLRAIFLLSQVELDLDARRNHAVILREKVSWDVVPRECDLVLREASAGDAASATLGVVLVDVPEEPLCAPGCQAAASTVSTVGLGNPLLAIVAPRIALDADLWLHDLRAEACGRASAPPPACPHSSPSQASRCGGSRGHG